MFLVYALKMLLNGQSEILIRNHLFTKLLDVFSPNYSNTGSLFDT